MKHTASASETSKSKSSSPSHQPSKSEVGGSNQVGFVVCVKNGGFVDLEILKVYKVKKDAKANSMGLLRVIDMSGEDYLYPKSYFCPIQAPRNLFSRTHAKAVAVGIGS